MCQYQELNFQNIGLKIDIKLQKNRFAYNSWTQCKWRALKRFADEAKYQESSLSIRPYEKVRPDTKACQFPVSSVQNLD